MRSPRFLLLAATLVSALTAQGVNCDLLGTFNNHGPFNDVWGYTAPNGDEYALLGTTTGTVVVDVSNPATPVERGWFPWGSSGWRDIRTYGHYAYVVTEATAGFQILDLSNPNSPQAVGFFGTANSNDAHNVCVDTGAGRLYLVGSGVGTSVYDLTANPANPTFLGYALGPGNSNYFHDLCVENGYVYGSMIYNGTVRIIDAASSFPWGQLSDTGTPGHFTHNAWPNAAGTVLVATDEITGGVASFWDISDKANPVPLGQFTPNPASVPHNAFIVGDRCHVSWYTEGYRCIDISDPSNPVEVASYDTWPGASGGFSGAWGCYPFLPSGNVLVSDRTTGLYVVKPTDASFHTYGQGCPGSSAQPCPELNPGGGTLTNDTRDNEYCYHVANPGSITVTGFQIWTASTGGVVTRPVAIYADAGGVPAPAATATATMSITATPGFHTATLGSPVTITGDFYVGLDSSSQNVYVSNLTTGVTGLGFWRDNLQPNWTISGLVQHPSYVIQCSSTGTATPEIGNVGLPILGTTFDVTLSSARASAAAFFITGLSDSVFQGTPLPAPIPNAPGCSIHAAPDTSRLVFTTATGTAGVSFALPGSPSFAGLTLFHQWAILDPVNAIGIVVSDAGRSAVDL